MTDTLPVHLYGRHVADFRRGGNGLELDWGPSAARFRGRAELSASLRTGIPAAAGAVENFFGGLLPEGPWLGRLSNELGLHHSDVFGLLANVGGDLAGALSVGQSHRARAPERLDPERLPQLLEEAGGYFVGGGGSALPGYQRKIALTRFDGQWWLGNGTVPSTHILKPSTALNSRIADAETYLLALSRVLGLTTFDSWTERIGELSVVVIERYDRTVGADGTVQRIHQEDAAQALSLPWLSDAKFQRTDRRANLGAIAGLIDTDRTVFDTSEADRVRLLRYVTFNLAVGNTDAHAKNFSILRPETGVARLAPLYDLVPLAVLSEARLGLPLWINQKRMSNEVTVADLIAEAAGWGVPVGDATAAITETLEQLVVATREVSLPASVAGLLPGYIRTQASALLDGGPAAVAGPIPAYFRTEIGTPGPMLEGDETKRDRGERG